MHHQYQYIKSLPSEALPSSGGGIDDLTRYRDGDKLLESARQRFENAFSQLRTDIVHHVDGLVGGNGLVTHSCGRASQ